MKLPVWLERHGCSNITRASVRFTSRSMLFVRRCHVLLSHSISVLFKMLKTNSSVYQSSAFILLTPPCISFRNAASSAGTRTASLRLIPNVCGRSRNVWYACSETLRSLCWVLTVVLASDVTYWWKQILPWLYWITSSLFFCTSHWSSSAFWRT